MIIKIVCGISDRFRGVEVLFFVPFEGVMRCFEQDLEFSCIIMGARVIVLFVMVFYRLILESI